MPCWQRFLILLPGKCIRKARLTFHLNCSNGEKKKNTSPINFIFYCWVSHCSHFFMVVILFVWAVVSLAQRYEYLCARANVFNEWRFVIVCVFVCVCLFAKRCNIYAKFFHFAITYIIIILPSFNRCEISYASMRINAYLRSMCFKQNVYMK